MQQASLFQSVLQNLLLANEKLEQKTSNGSARDSAEHVKLTRCLMMIAKSLFEADEYDAVEYDDDYVHSWSTGFKEDNGMRNYVWLQYMPCENNHGIYRLQHYVLEGDREISKTAYMISFDGRNVMAGKYTGDKVPDNESVADWEI